MYIPSIRSILVGASLAAGEIKLQAPTVIFSNTSTPLILPPSQPLYAERLDPHLASFSIELDNWPVWAGKAVGKPNNYTVNLLENLGARTGRGVHVRIGGNTEDRTKVDLTLEVGNATIPPPTDQIPYHEANAVSVGRDFYALSKNLPDKTLFTWGLNMRSMNVTEIQAQAALLASSFTPAASSLPDEGGDFQAESQLRLVNVEIGNEVDGFKVTPYTNITFTHWTSTNYSYTWAEYAKNISTVLNITDGTDRTRPAFQLGSFMSSGNNQPWNNLNVLGTGILNDPVLGNGTNVWSDHVYTGVWGMGDPPKVGQLMGRGTVRGVLNGRSADVRVARKAGLKFIWGETNSYANHGAPGVSNTAEAAIWATDYFLQSAVMGISRVHLHHGLGYRYNSFQPIAGLDDNTNITRAHILPLYHAYLIVNEAIGTSRKAYVAELGSLDGVLSAYGVWEEGQLRRMVLINSAVYASGEEKARSALSVTMGGWASYEAITARRLYTPYTNSYSGLTWAGQSFETTDGVPAGNITEENVVNGTLAISASEVVLLSFTHL